MPKKKKNKENQGQKEKKPIEKSAKKTKKTVKTKKARKKRADSTSFKSDVLSAFFGGVQIPNHLKLLKREEPYFESVINECAAMEWTSHSIELAFVLARDMCMLIEEQKRLSIEGTVLNGNSKMYENPRKKVVDSLQKNVLSIRRSLGIHARGQQGEARDITRARAIAKDQENKAKQYEDDFEFLAKPQAMQ